MLPHEIKLKLKNGEYKNKSNSNINKLYKYK